LTHDIYFLDNILINVPDMSVVGIPVAPPLKGVTWP